VFGLLIPFAFLAALLAPGKDLLGDRARGLRTGSCSGRHSVSPSAARRTWRSLARGAGGQPHELPRRGDAGGAARDRGYAFVAKREFEASFLMARCSRGFGTQFIERFDIAKSAEHAGDMTAAAKRGVSLVVFPEGTLTRARA
jgi:hypothetical protein